MHADLELVPLALHVILADPSAPWADVRIQAQAWHVARSVYGSKDEDDEKRLYRALQAAAHASPKPADPAAELSELRELKDVLLAECDRLRGNIKSVWAKAEAAAEAQGLKLVMHMPQETVALIRADDSSAAPAAELQARVAELEADVDRLTAERDEALRGPWEGWATRILKCVRAHSGDKGEDDAEGIDLPAEVEECLNVLAHEAEPMAKIGPAAVRAGYRGDVPVADFVCEKLAAREPITVSMTSEAFSDVLRVEHAVTFSTPDGGFVIRSHPELGAYPDSYRHAVMALARMVGIQLADDHGQALWSFPVDAAAPAAAG